MKAVVVVPGENGPSLAVREVPAPQPGPHDLLIRTRAVGLNRAELNRMLPKEGQVQIVGMEAAGEVIGMGAAATGFTIGDHVMSMGMACYAEVVSVDSRVALAVPADFNWEEAAATPVHYLTAHDALRNGEFVKGETVLIQGVTTGVGIAAVQVAKALHASRVLGTSRSDDKLARMEFGLGLDIGINSTTADVGSRILAATEGRGCDVILDNVGAGQLAANLAGAAIKGRIVSIGRLGGKLDAIDLDLLALKRVKLVGVTFRTRTIEEKAAITAEFKNDVYAALASRRLCPVIDRVFPFEDALAAQEYMRANAHLGKIVLRL
jgi:NADPH:quinone reductase-like Zn-dependent oxidoreductase